jgi:protein TonB
MKRNETKVPEFDEIIFENRNREYGAFDLRRRYKTVTSFSLLGAIAIGITLVLAAFFTTESGKAETGPATIVIAVLDNPLLDVPVQPEPQLPPELTRPPQNVAPVIVEDTTATDTFIPTTDDINLINTNRDVNDTVVIADVIPVDVVPAEPEIFVSVQEMPEFPGGQTALLQFIAKNLVYPDEAIENNIEGRIFIKFVVTPAGSVGKIELMKGVDPLLDKEAIRVIGTLPKFKPGKQNGEPVSVWYSVPVLFRITR